MHSSGGNKGSPSQPEQKPWTKKEMEEAEPLPMPSPEDEGDGKEPKKK